MKTTRIEPLRPVLAMLARRLKSEYPNVVAFYDDQDWTWPPQVGVEPGNFAFTVGVSGGTDMTAFVSLPDVNGVQARVIEFAGPPRAFLTGWDSVAKEPVCVSTPLMRVGV